MADCALVSLGYSLGCMGDSVRFTGSFLPWCIRLQTRERRLLGLGDNMTCKMCGKPTKPMSSGFGYRKTCSKTCMKNLQSENAHKISNNAGLPILTHKSIACKRPPMTEKKLKELL